MTLADSHHAGPIPAPPDFPVVWESPDDEKLFWTNDRMHWPDPVPMLLHSLAPEAGVNRAAPQYEAPIAFYARRINTYQYDAWVPLPIPPEEAEAHGKRAQEKMGAAMATLRERWEGEWLPEVQAHLAYWRGFDLRGASTERFVAHLDETYQRTGRLWEIHFLVGFPMLLSMSQLDELYRD